MLRSWSFSCACGGGIMSQRNFGAREPLMGSHSYLKMTSLGRELRGTYVHIVPFSFTVGLCELYKCDRWMFDVI